MPFDMEKVIFALSWLGTLTIGASAQLSYSAVDGSLGRPIIEPSLMVRPMKAKWCKKYAGRLGFDKDDLILQAKYRLAEKLLTRHLKNVNAGQWVRGNCLYDECRVAPGMRSAFQQALLPQQQLLGSWKNIVGGGQVEQRGVSGPCLREGLWPQHGCLGGSTVPHPSMMPLPK